MFRYGIISFCQAAKLANASKNLTSRIAKFEEEKKIVSIRRIQCVPANISSVAKS